MTRFSLHLLHLDVSQYEIKSWKLSFAKVEKNSWRSKQICWRCWGPKNFKSPQGNSQSNNYYQHRLTSGELTVIFLQLFEVSKSHCSLISLVVKRVACALHINYIKIIIVALIQIFYWSKSSFKFLLSISLKFHFRVKITIIQAFILFLDIFLASNIISVDFNTR